LATVADDALTTMIAVDVATAVCIAWAPSGPPPVAATAAYTAGTVMNPPPNPNITVVIPVTQPTASNSRKGPITELTLVFGPVAHNRSSATNA
jgi:hypothetical protein